MTRDDILAAFDRIRVWQQGDRRAVHKPLLVLLALGRLARGEAPIVEFAEIEGKLGALLKQFGPSGSESTRHNPFWHLKTDGIWQLVGPPNIITRPPAATPNITELRLEHVAGGFAEQYRLAFVSDPTLVAEIAQRIVSAHFPASIQQEVLDAVGLNVETNCSTSDSRPERRRDSGLSGVLCVRHIMSTERNMNAQASQEDAESQCGRPRGGAAQDTTGIAG